MPRPRYVNPVRRHPNHTHASGNTVGATVVGDIGGVTGAAAPLPSGETFDLTETGAFSSNNGKVAAVSSPMYGVTRSPSIHVVPASSYKPCNQTCYNPCTALGRSVKHETRPVLDNRL